MAAQETPSAPAKTPAQTAKPYGTAAAAAEKAKKATKAPPKAEEDKPSPEEALKAVEKLETKTKAARVANSQLTANDEKLLPLMSLKTGKSIEKFPATSKDIEKLSVTTVDAILNALDADRAGAEAIKKEKLRVQIGLKPNPA
ncbi:hypothetical protein LTR27_006185 [Elasticomyces elasticus]|nr:hypothetical protein LTR27_006185 [Elasticomyces elasticus]